MAAVVIIVLVLGCCVWAVTCGCLVYLVHELHDDVNLFANLYSRVLDRDEELPPPRAFPGP
jgi:hypothetical protein